MKSLGLFKNFRFILFLSSFLIFLWLIIIGVVSIDPDFGWHLKFGEIIQSTQSIPKLDPFSYTMPSYNFINHEWLTDLLIALFYPIGKELLLSAAFALITIFALVIQAKNVSKKWFIVLFILGLFAMNPIFGIRPQLISFLFFSVILTVLLNDAIYKKIFYFLPLLFLLWANLHGGFVMGIVFFGIGVILKMIKEKGFYVKDAIVFIFCIVFTLINPYGINLWKEIIISATDTNLRWSIAEWFPTFLFFNFPLIILWVISFVLFIKYFKKLDLILKILYLMLFLWGLSSNRNIPFFILISIIIISKGFDFLYADLGKYKFGRQRFLKLYFAIGTVFIFLTVLSAIFSFINLRLYQKVDPYPTNAVAFLKENSSSGQLFSTYNWGGFLIWKLPEKKVFVDGRMPSWKMKSPPKGQSENAFLEWNKIQDSKISVKTVIKKYKIDTFLLPLTREKNEKLAKINNFALSLLRIKQSGPKEFIRQIEDLGMKEVYKDSTVVIYR
ncbi:MAG: hypothetical protein HY344_03040 [Candidatus Levybacteria bacterium]|nr:hypothetical protein [Candidatus Levybacteria bacterium]